MASPLVVDDLPTHLAFDCGALVRALGARSEEEVSPKCVALWVAARAAKVQILVPAMVLAEMVRGGPERPPRDAFSAVYPFDDEAATLLGEKLPEHFLRAVAGEEARPIHYVKYDALIVCCAKRHNAGGIVSLDRRFRALAERIGLPAWHVGDLVRTAPPPPQLTLELSARPPDEQRPP